LFALIEDPPRKVEPMTSLSSQSIHLLVQLSSAVLLVLIPSRRRPVQGDILVGSFSVSPLVCPATLTTLYASSVCSSPCDAADLQAQAAVSKHRHRKWDL